MKSILLMLSLFLITTTVSVSWALDPNDDMPTDQMTSQESPSKNKADGTMVKWLIVLDKNEIALANEAMKRPINPKVRDYARFLFKEHNQNLRQTLALSERDRIQPRSSDAAMSMKENGKKELAKLKTLHNKQFQKDYIDAMVKGHTAALKTLQSDIENVHNPKLKKHLEMTEKHIQMHLKKAKALQEKLG